MVLSLICATSFGEINHYDFVDEVSALVAKDFDPSLFSHKMDFVIQHPNESEVIGQRGKSMGIKHFNYKTIGKTLQHFFVSLQ